MPEVHKPSNPGRPSICGILVIAVISVFVDSFLKPLAPRNALYIHGTPYFPRRLTGRKFIVIVVAVVVVVVVVCVCGGATRI